MTANITDRHEQRDVAARWTPHLAAGGWTPVVDYFLDHYRELGVTNIEAVFLIHLIRSGGVRVECLEKVVGGQVGLELGGLALRHGILKN